jgi:predicted DNA-binding transcriptional regulator AlpA
MSTKFLRKKAVGERYGVTLRSVERMVDDGRLPSPVYRGRMPLWREADLDESDRAAALLPRPEKRAGANRNRDQRGVERRVVG